MPPKRPRELVGYVSVTTGRQGRSGLGLDAQRDALTRFAEAEAFELVKVLSKSKPARAQTPSTVGHNWQRR